MASHMILEEYIWKVVSAFLKHHLERRGINPNCKYVFNLFHFLRFFPCKLFSYSHNLCYDNHTVAC